ncbi:MAG: DNA polymerase III subunit [Bacteroidaceae bacterium]|nr:DNA polymerase III subunit [Bacteroidaceae bacterium]
MFFRDIVGQEKVKQQLIDEINENRIPHAQLFYGPTGTGKLPLAIAFARYINCTDRGTTDACGKCPSCLKFNKLVHPDIHFSFPTVNTKTSDDFIAQWRDCVLNNPYFDLSHWLIKMKAENAQAIIYAKESTNIIKKLSLKSSEGGYKISIIWLPEKMHPTCANDLLKIIEEPPEKTLFLLITEAPDKIIPTIVSRTQRIDVPRVDEESIAKALQERHQIIPEESFHIAHMANGNVIKALDCITLNKDHEVFFDSFVNLMRLAYQRNIKPLKQWSDAMAGLGRERQKNFLEYSQQLIRENFIYNFKSQTMNYMTLKETNFSKNFARFINEGNVSEIMFELSEAQRHIEQNVNSKMVFFDFSLKMIVLLKH